MQKFLSLFSQNRFYFRVLFFIIITGIIISGLADEQMLNIPISHPHPFWLNVFFINYTFTGDSLFIISLSAFLLIYLKKIQLGTQLFVAFVICTFLVQLIKNWISPGGFELFIEQGQYLFSTDTAPTADQFSFPSGHTAISFSMTTIFALNSKKTISQIFLLLAAFLLAFSRIYLAQHQLFEVISGMIIGSISGVFALVITWFAFSRQHIFRGRKHIRIISSGKTPDFLAS